MKTVGAYEAKTHLSWLLEDVVKGETIAITKHGVVVATLAPPAGARRPDIGPLIDAWREYRRNITLGPELTIRQMIEEGRR